MPTEATPIATRSAAAVGDRGAIVAVFNALSDPTRLAVVERLSIGPASATELSRPFDMGLPAFMQHLGVLADAGIVTSHKAGRTRTFQLAPGGTAVDGDLAVDVPQPLGAPTRPTPRAAAARQHPRNPFVPTKNGAIMTTFTPNPDLDLVLDRTVAVSPAKVWKAWTTPELVMEWFTPAPWRTVACDIDLRPGGRFASTMQSPEGEQFPNAGCYLAVEPDRLLVFTSVLGDGYRPTSASNGAEDLPFTARIELTPTAEGGTHYRAIAIHPDRETCKRHEEMGFHDGWGTALDQLVALMS